MLKAPKFERKHILALKVLVRLDFARAIRFKMEALKKNPEAAVESTVKLMTLTDMLNEAEQPLAITLALLDMHQAKEAQIPLTEARFNFFMKTLAVDVTEADFENTPPDPIRVAISALKELQEDLRNRFTTAEQLDPHEMVQHNHDEAPAGKMMN